MLKKNILFGASMLAILATTPALGGVITTYDKAGDVPTPLNVTEHGGVVNFLDVKHIVHHCDFMSDPGCMEIYDADDYEYDGDVVTNENNKGVLVFKDNPLYDYYDETGWRFNGTIGTSDKRLEKIQMLDEANGATAYEDVYSDVEITGSYYTQLKKTLHGDVIVFDRGSFHLSSDAYFTGDVIFDGENGGASVSASKVEKVLTNNFIVKGSGNDLHLNSYSDGNLILSGAVGADGHKLSQISVSVYSGDVTFNGNSVWSDTLEIQSNNLDHGLTLTNGADVNANIASLSYLKSALTLDNATVNGDIGASDNKLELIKITANGGVVNGKIFAEDINFIGDGTLSLNNNVTANITTTDNNQGALVFDGVTYTGNIGTADKKIKSIEVSGDANSISGDVYVKDDILIKDDGILTLTGNVNAYFNTATDNTGTLVLDGANLYIANGLDKGGNLKDVIISANGATIDGEEFLNANKISLKDDARLVMKDSQNIDIFTNADNTGTLVLDNSSYKANVGTADKKLKLIEVSGDYLVLGDEDKDVYTNEIRFTDDTLLNVYKTHGEKITTTANGQGNLIIEARGETSTYNNIGQEGKALGGIFFNTELYLEDADFYVNDISAIISNEEELHLINANLHGSIASKSELPLLGAPTKQISFITISGNSSVSGSIGEGVAVDGIAVAPNADVTFGGNIYGDLETCSDSVTRIGSNKQVGGFYAEAGSTLHVTLTPETTVDKGHVYFGDGDDKTEVEAGVNLVLSSKGTLDKGSVYHIVDSAMDGDDAYVNMPTITDTGLVDYEAYLTKSDDYKGERVAEGEAGSDLFVEITKKSAASVVSDPIAQKTSHVIDEIRSGTPTGDMATVIDVIEHLPDAGAVEKTLHDLAPEVSGGAVDGAMAAATQVGDAVSSRIAKTSLVDMMISSGSTSSTSGVSSGDEAEANYGLWGQVMLASAQQDVRHGQDGYEVKNYGFVFGADRLFGDNMAGGIGLAYINTDVSGRGGSSNNSTIVDSYQLSAYGSYMFDSPWYVEGQAAVSYNDYSGSRYISGLGRTAKADYQGWQVGARAEAGYSMDYKGVKFVPSFGMTMTHLYINNYEEAGAGGVSLVVDAQEYDFASARAGLEVSWKSAEDDNGWVFAPRGKLGFNRSLYADKADVSARFAGGGTMFDAQGLRPEQNSVDIGLGVDLMSSKGLTVSLDGDVLLKEGYQSKTGMIKARFDF
jgi:outer membrane autotransporter protein